MRIGIFYIFGFVVLSLFFSCEKEVGMIDVGAEIIEEMDLLGIPSVVACVVDSIGITWTGNYGYANKEYNILASSETIYSLQSISKTFLSITVFQLWEEGKIDLDKDINEYLPFEVRNPYYPDSIITSYMLLNHASGLARPADEEYIPDFHHFFHDEEPPLILEWVPDYILPDGNNYRWYVWKDYPPGEKYLYSNIGTSLLAIVVEQISGMDYRDYCKEKILVPLGMTNSSFYLKDLDYAKIATPYDNNDNPMWYFTSRHYPAGFLNCSLNDYALFVQACINDGSLHGKRILKEATMRKMLELQNEQIGIANLWFYNIGGTVGHTGGGTGWSTCVEMDMKNRSAFIIFSNKYLSSVYHKGSIYGLVKYQYYESIE